jgi:hypothetical protein
MLLLGFTFRCVCNKGTIFHSDDQIRMMVLGNIIDKTTSRENFNG